MQETFSLFVPVDIIEKADAKKDKDGLPDELLIGGVVSSPHYGKDKDGQTLNPSGFDYRPLLDDGYLNLEHAYNKTKDASMIVGEPTNAFVKGNEFHIEGRLWKDNPKAVAMYKLGQILKKSGSSRKIGYSLEGVPTEFDPLDKNIVKAARITGIALTLSPKCKGTQMLIKGGEAYETQEGSEFLVDIVDDNGDRITVDKNLNISKAMQAGSITGTDTTDQALTQEPLKEESIGAGYKKKKKKKSNIVNLEFSKSEVFTHLINEYNMDIESCKNVWSLIAQIQKNISQGITN